MVNVIHLILELCSSGLSQTHRRRGLCRPLDPAILQDRWPGDPYRQASPFCSWSSSWPGNLPAKTSCRQSRSRSWRWRSQRSARNHPEASRHCDGLRSRVVEIISTQSRFLRAPDAALHRQQPKEKGADCAAPMLSNARCRWRSVVHPTHSAIRSRLLPTSNIEDARWEWL
jgi:hypothetical protein